MPDPWSRLKNFDSKFKLSNASTWTMSPQYLRWMDSLSRNESGFHMQSIFKTICWNWVAWKHRRCNAWRINGAVCKSARNSPAPGRKRCIHWSNVSGYWNPSVFIWFSMLQAAPLQFWPPETTNLFSNSSVKTVLWKVNAIHMLKLAFCSVCLKSDLASFATRSMQSGSTCGCVICNDPAFWTTNESRCQTLLTWLVPNPS